MPGRKFVSGEEYRFGFNGKEDDRDWGMQNIQDYGFRLYNPSIGKFLSVDPLSPDYPWYTPYQFAGNTPIQAIDLDGLETRYTQYLDQKYASKAYLNKTSSERIGEEKEKVDALREAGTYTDLNDGYVLITAAFTGNPQQVNGEPASAVDITLATAGIFLPVVSGSALSKAGKSFYKGLFDVDVVADDVIVHASDFADEVADLAVKEAGDDFNAYSQALKDIGADVKDGKLPSGTKKYTQENTNAPKSAHGNSVNSTKPSGNYEHTFESGKTYDGVGGKERMKQSGLHLEKVHKDKIIESKWTPAANKKEALIKEHKAIFDKGGPESPKTYNRYNSPGKNINE